MATEMTGARDKPTSEWISVPADDPNRSFSDSLLPETMISAGMAVMDRVDGDNASYVSGATIDWDYGMAVVAVYRAMVAASPPAPDHTELIAAVRGIVEHWPIGMYPTIDRLHRAFRALIESGET